MAAMIAKELEALDRFIAAAKSSAPLLILAKLFKVDISEYEVLVREIATKGMTLEQAKDFRKATDTQEERDNIGRILEEVYPNTEDNKILLDWAWEEMERVLATDLPAKPEIPSSENLPFDPRIGISGLTYYWSLAYKQNTLEPALVEISSICDSIGLPRNVVVFTLETHSDGGRPGAGVDWKTHFKERAALLPTVVKIIESYGFGTVIFAWNSNTPGKGYSKTWNKSDILGNKNYILDILRPMIRSIGHSKTMWSLCNESDDSTHSDIQSALRGLKKEMGIPDSRYLSRDEHPKNVNNLPSLNPPATFTSDNGEIISALYDSSNFWSANGFNIGNHKKVIDKYANKVLFSYYNLVLEDSILKHKNAWREVLSYYKTKVSNLTSPEINPSNGQILPSKVKWLTSRGKGYSNARVSFDLTAVEMVGKELRFKKSAPFPEEWKEREKGVNSVGLLIRKIGSEYIGGKCEWCVEGRGWYDIRTNVLQGYNGHTVPKDGEICWAGIGAPDDGNKCSSLVPFKWGGGIVAFEEQVSEFADLDQKYENISS